MVTETEIVTKGIRPSILDRQKRERILLQALYNEMPIGVEVKFMRASRVADKLGISTGFVDSAVRTFEELGILTRRLEFGAKDTQGKTITGRSYHWTMLLFKDEALPKLDKYYEAENNERIQPKNGNSLKSRIMMAFTDHDKFETMDDLAKAVRRNNENLDYHNLTHVMESLAQEGKITFDRGTTKSKIPFNIRLTKNGNKSIQPIKPEDIVLEKSTVIVEDHADDWKNPWLTPIAPVTDTEKYPTISKLFKRREWLESAAKLAENAEEEDLAITLLERANKPFSVLEQEAIDLFQAYKSCKDSK
jgi:DNA-binding MarR family transcriptional regulator